MNSPFTQFLILTMCEDVRTDNPRAVVNLGGPYYAATAAAEYDDAALRRVGPLNWDSAVDERGFRRNPQHLYPCPECGGQGEFTPDDLRVRCRDRKCPLRAQELPRGVWQHLGRGMAKADGRIRKLRGVVNAKSKGG
jgi:hypothetical protein